MAQAFEVAFIQHLVVPDSLAEIVHMELPDELLPTGALRAVHHFAIDYWHTESSGKVPSPQAMRVHFDAILAEHQIDLDIDPEDTLAWALECLRGNFIDRHWQGWVRKFSTDMAGGDVLGKSTILSEGIEQLMTLQSSLATSNERVDLRHAVDSALDRYQQRVELRALHQVSGALLGFREIDEHTGGIRDGELAIVGGVPKVGKSYEILHGALATHANGGEPTVVVLENSIDMSVDRTACMALGIDARRWERGEALPDEVERVRQWRTFMADHPRPIHFIAPSIGQRTMQHLVRMGKALGDSLYIDQLTFVEPDANSLRLPRHVQLGNSLHDLKALISTGRSIPCVMAHQINREGQKLAEKAGRLEMYHMAEAAEVERTADFGFGLFQTPSMRDLSMLYFQSLAARRTDLIHWQIAWKPWIGEMQLMHTVRLDAA